MTEDVELLQAMIRNGCINDGHAAVGEEPNADLIASSLAGSGFDVSVYDAAPGRRSVVARLPGTDPSAPALMLLGHTDVVPVDPARWRHDPFGAEIIDGSVWGRGALDMLGHVATMTLAARDHARRGGHRGGDLVVAMVADEEALGRFGMGWLTEEHADAVRADWVVTETGGAPSGPADDPRLSVLAAEKGAWRVRLAIGGGPGHSSMPYGTANGLVAAGEAITRIARTLPAPAVTDPWRAFVQAGWGPNARNLLLDPTTIDDVLPALPDFPARAAHALTRMTIVPTEVSSTSSWNTMPRGVTVGLDVRTLPGQTEEDVRAAVTDALTGIDADIAVEVLVGMPASESAAEGPFWDLLQHAAAVQAPRARLIPTMAAGATDARFMRRLGATAYGFGMMSERAPVAEIPQMLHGDNERVDLESLAMMRRLWGDLLDQFSARTGQSA